MTSDDGGATPPTISADVEEGKIEEASSDAVEVGCGPSAASMTAAPPVDIARGHETRWADVAVCVTPATGS